MTPDDLIALGINPSGQMRADEFVHNAGFYTLDGVKLGWGDLNKADLQRLAQGLKEPLFILDEQASFWNFVTRVGSIGAMARTRDEIRAPGTAYCVQHARIVIAGGEIYIVDRELPAFRTIRREQLAELVAATSITV